MVVDLQAHEGALWSLAVRPDGKVGASSTVHRMNSVATINRFKYS